MEECVASKAQKVERMEHCHLERSEGFPEILHCVQDDAFCWLLLTTPYSLLTSRYTSPICSTS